MLTGHYIRLTEAILQGQPHFSFLELQVHPRKMQQTESTQFEDIYNFDDYHSGDGCQSIGVPLKKQVAPVVGCGKYPLERIFYAESTMILDALFLY
ncbi:unnamed protein product [Linum trigynum]|uniref:Uncharacterized protein n=1 Tax=Linum trigynum TaxID=586398 RepID=A0AAV2G4P7_9ROSI